MITLRTWRMCKRCMGAKQVDSRDVSPVTTTYGMVTCPSCGGNGVIEESVCEYSEEADK